MSTPTLPKSSLEPNTSYGTRESITYDSKTKELSITRSYTSVRTRDSPIFNAQLGLCHSFYSCLETSSLSLDLVMNHALSRRQIIKFNCLSSRMSTMTCTLYLYISSQRYPSFLDSRAAVSILKILVKLSFRVHPSCGSCRCRWQPICNI